MTRIRIILVRLLNAPGEVWRPVISAWRDQDTFQILEQDVPLGEVWEFVPGQTVLVKTVKSKSEEFLITIRERGDPDTQ